jgi:hypothetical protein
VSRLEMKSMKWILKTINAIQNGTVDMRLLLLLLLFHLHFQVLGDV